MFVGMSTPLQFTEYLSRALDVGFRIGQKPIVPELVSATLAPDLVIWSHSIPGRAIP